MTTPIISPSQQRRAKIYKGSACDQCFRRKVRCSGESPECARCLEDRRSCTYSSSKTAQAADGTKSVPTPKRRASDGHHHRNPSFVNTAQQTPSKSHTPDDQNADALEFVQAHAKNSDVLSDESESRNLQEIGGPSWQSFLTSSEGHSNMLLETNDEFPAESTVASFGMSGIYTSQIPRRQKRPQFPRLITRPSDKRDSEILGSSVSSPAKHRAIRSSHVASPSSSSAESRIIDDDLPAVALALTGCHKASVQQSLTTIRESLMAVSVFLKNASRSNLRDDIVSRLMAGIYLVGRVIDVLTHVRLRLSQSQLTHEDLRIHDLQLLDLQACKRVMDIVIDENVRLCATVISKLGTTITSTTFDFGWMKPTMSHFVRQLQAQCQAVIAA